MKKEDKQIRRNISISPETDKKIREIAAKTGLKLSKVIDKAIEKYEL